MLHLPASLVLDAFNPTFTLASTATASVFNWATLIAAAIALAGVLITLGINGDRTERQRRRDLHARALAAITAYGEMPYRIRRRPEGSETRTRLSDDLSAVKSELDTCQVLLAADGDDKISAAFDDLYAIARRTAGYEANQAWGAPLITEDSQMNQGDLYRRLQPFNTARTRFANDLRTATLPRRKRLWRQAKISAPILSRIPGGNPPRDALAQQSVAAQDLAPSQQPEAPAGQPAFEPLTTLDPALPDPAARDRTITRLDGIAAITLTLGVSLFVAGLTIGGTVPMAHAARSLAWATAAICGALGVFAGVPLLTGPGETPEPIPWAKRHVGWLLAALLVVVYALGIGTAFLARHEAREAQNTVTTTTSTTNHG